MELENAQKDRSATVESLQTQLNDREARFKLELQEVVTKYERRMQEDKLQDLDLIGSVKREKQFIEDQMFQDQNRVRNLQDALDQLQHKLKEVTHSRDEFEARCRDMDRLKLENDRLTQVEVQSKKLKEQKREDDF